MEHIDYTQLYEEYKSGTSVKELSKLHNIKAPTIAAGFRRNKFPVALHKHRYQKSESEDKIRGYYKEHQQGTTLQMLSEKYNRSRKYFIHHFKYYSLSIIQHRENWRTDFEVYPKDHNFFRAIDTELKAYLLGFFAADGHICKTEKAIVVTTNDDYVTDLFRDTIAPGLKLTISGKARMFNCYSKQVVQDLKTHGGLCTRKSWQELWFPELPVELQRHYIRGFFDGDGWCSVGTCKLGYPYRIAGICAGSYNSRLIREIGDILQSNSIDVVYETRPHDQLVKVLVKKVQAFKNLYEFLYKDATYYLKRKHDKVKLGMATPREVREVTNFQPRNA